MKKTIYIEGMMCGHCTASVEKALKGIPGVTNVEVSLEENRAEVFMKDTIEDEIMKKVVVDAGYQVTNII